MMKRYVCGAVAAWMTVLGCVFTAFADDHVSPLRGRILGEGRPLAGVSVSDGRRIVTTNDHGGYELPLDGQSGRLVFVTLLRGYWSEEFYFPLEAAIHEGGVDFELDRVEQPDRFAFAFLADMHLERREIGRPKLDATLAELNNKAPKVSFLLFQGDICLQAGAGDIYVDCLQAAEMPVRHGAGNHEMVLEHDNPRDEFERRFGPTYYSFDWGPLHCIVLDGNKPIPGQSGWQAVHGAVEGSELEWLKADLAAQPRGKLIVVGVCSTERSQNWGDSSV